MDDFAATKGLPKYAIVIGASAGGLNALQEVIPQLKKEIDAAFFIVLHLSAAGVGKFLVDKLQNLTPFPCLLARDGMAVARNHIYIAPANHHLIVKSDHILLGNGPKESRWRPSIDVLFRSAAAAFASATIGVILTGFLDDGVAGMWAIQKSGGICIVQDPDEAEHPDMPLAVLEKINADHLVRLRDIGPLIYSLTDSKRPSKRVAPREVILEAQIAEKAAIGFEEIKQIGERSVFACPDCGGGLWQVTEGKMNRFRCHIGHSYSESELSARQGETIEATLWIALRIMEERKALLIKMHDANIKRGLNRIAAEYSASILEIEGHIIRLRNILFEEKTIIPPSAIIDSL